MTAYLVVAAVAAAVTFLASSLVLRLSRRFQLAPEVRERDVHQAPTPRLGGIAMYLGILVAFAVAAAQDALASVFANPAQVWAILGACTMIVAVGVLDDLFDLDWMVKLSVQLLASGLLAWQGVQILSLPFGNTLIVGSPVVNFVLTVFVITLVMNAVNFVDGLDGLVAGVALIANLAFFVYTMLLAASSGPLNSVTLASMIAAALVGVCVGFLPFNWHRARMFMGDTGALLIGLLMAVSTISVTGQLSPSAINPEVVIASYIPIILPIAVLVVPLADFTLAVVRRIRAGKSPFSADRKHLHHRLLDMGHSHVQAVCIFYLWTATLSLGCLLVFVLQSYQVPALVVSAGALLCLVVTFVPIAPRRRAAAARKELLALAVPDAAAPESALPDPALPGPAGTPATPDERTRP